MLVDPFWWVWFLFKKFHFHTKFHLGLWASCPPCGHIITESVHHGFNEVTILTTEFQQNIVCWTWCVISVPLMSLINGGVFVCVYVCVCVFVFVCPCVCVCREALHKFIQAYMLQHNCAKKNNKKNNNCACRARTEHCLISIKIQKCSNLVLLELSVTLWLLGCGGVMSLELIWHPPLELIWT